MYDPVPTPFATLDVLESGTLERQIAGLHQGHHVCLIYESRAEQLRTMIPFVAIGLKRNEVCSYIADDRTADEFEGALADAGIDVAREKARRALAVLTKREVYLRSGQFNPHAMIDFLREASTEALRQGFSGFRVTGEMTWALGPEPGCDRVIEYESLLNRFFPNSHALAICQYNRHRFDPEIIRDVLRTHPLAVWGGEVHDNLFYETPEMVAGHESPAGRVAWMLAQLQRTRKTERALVDSNQRLEVAVRARDDFMQVAAHELKTPLTPLQLQLDRLWRMLSNVGDQALRDKVLQQLSTALRQTERLTALIENLLDSARITSGRLTLSLAETDLAALAVDVVDRFQAEARQRGCLLTVDAQPVQGAWDRLRLEQLLGNLIGNALKYGAGAPVQVEVRDVGEGARLKVRDQGIGIAPEQLPHIFERFARAAPFTLYGGLGLGLFISREIVKAHSGCITVESKPGAGATFTVDLPTSVPETVELRRSAPASGL